MDDHNNNFLFQLDEAVKILCRLSEQLHGNADAPAPAFSPPTLLLLPPSILTLNKTRNINARK